MSGQPGLHLEVLQHQVCVRSGSEKGFGLPALHQPSMSLLSFPLPTCLASWRMRYHPLGHPAYPSLPSDTLLLVAPREIEFRAWSLWSRDREVVGGSLPWDSRVGVGA